MKNKINSTLHDKSNLIKASSDGNEAMGQLLKLGLDVDLRNIAVAIQCERGAIGPARKFTREQLIAWVKQKSACGVGVLRFRLHAARAAHWGRNTLAPHYADAFESGAAAQERSDGCAGVVCAAVTVSGRTPG
ncbi:MAG: hypothetical protein E6L08_13120 [Verrucomicrobia bacterium]|nr:MAG: hypothetical protein E6L08_13120 [Verrucomicrobiota bacterium]